MRIPSPIVTLVVGVLLAAIVAVLSIRAHDAATKPQPTPSGYGLAVTGA